MHRPERSHLSPLQKGDEERSDGGGTLNPKPETKIMKYPPTRILTFTPVWQRPHIFNICLKGLARLQSYKPEKYKIQPFFIISESDMARPILDHGFSFIFAQNNPLGAKKNAGLEYVLNHYEFDYLLELGSDDLITNSYLDFIGPEMKFGTPQFCPSNVWFINTLNGKTGFWDSPKIIGLGRCISRKAIEKLHGKPLWTPDRPRGMDTCSWRMLQAHGVTNKVLDAGRRVFTLDLKSNVNLNNINSFATGDKTVREILHHFPNESEDILKIILRSAGDYQSPAE